jgi:integrase/recombinase XerD
VLSTHDASLIDQFTVFASEQKHLSPSTVVAYVSDVSRFAEYTSSRGSIRGGLSRAIKNSIVSWLNARSRKGASAQTLNRSIASLRCFFRWAVASKHVPKNPTEEILRRSRRGASTIVAAAPDTAERILSVIDGSTRLGARDRAIVRVIAEMGARCSEVLALMLDDYDPALHSLRLGVRGSHTCRWMRISDEASSDIGTWITHRAHMTPPENRHLFVSIRGEVPTRQGIWKVLHNYAQIAGIPDASPRALRGACARIKFDTAANPRRELGLHAHTPKKRYRTRAPAPGAVT